MTVAEQVHGGRPLFLAGVQHLVEVEAGATGWEHQWAEERTQRCLEAQRGVLVCGQDVAVVMAVDGLVRVGPQTGFAGLRHELQSRRVWCMRVRARPFRAPRALRTD